MIDALRSREKPSSLKNSKPPRRAVLPEDREEKVPS
jgi:hypothetical protein